MKKALGIVISLVVFFPAMCYCGVTTGYEAYTAWEQWARLKSGVTGGLASSYDRVGDNNDFSHYEDPNGVRTANEIVTAKTIQGPGVIYRFWMPHYTAVRNFDVRMYFDGEPSPRIDTNSVELLGGSYNYFTAPLINTCAGGQVCYEPIGFSSSVRIETENKALPNHPLWNSNRHYYQYTYQTFPEGTQVDSYTGTLSSEAQTARAEMVMIFDNAGEHPAGPSITAIDVNTAVVGIDPCSTVTLANLTGPGMIRKLNIKMTDPNDAELEGLRLRVYYDGSSTASIDASIGNFFGAGKQRVVYKSLPLGTDSNDGYYCYWPMPFRDSVLVELYNAADTVISIDSAIVEYEPSADVKKMCYLHVTESTSIKQQEPIYHPILSAAGCGHYVGNLLYLEQDSYSFSMLEGDEVITVDGSNVLYGTGLEDAYSGGYYYNWVACHSDEPEGTYPQSAFRPLSGILYVHRTVGVEHARADQYRWQIADCVPFSQSIDVKIENIYGAIGGTWTSVAFWYKYWCVEADFDSDCDVDFNDFAQFTLHWTDENCDEPDWCGGADFNQDHQINIVDIAFLADNWL